MGLFCFKNIRNNNYFQKETKILFADKRSQIYRLEEILKKVEIEIIKLKRKNVFVNRNNIQIKKRMCYLAQMKIFVKFSIKVVEVNEEDRKIDSVIDKMEDLLDDEDEFVLNSLENKIKHLINFKK